VAQLQCKAFHELQALLRDERAARVELEGKIDHIYTLMIRVDQDRDLAELRHEEVGVSHLPTNPAPCRRKLPSLSG
jgi:hypothetical protein